jgi:8-oxo-dGTP pyrophosphatase MutT (NUDIX family)
MGVQSSIRRALEQLVPRTVEDGFAREAAVLIPVFEREGRPHFLLTRRTERVSTHKGQISFPGGMRISGEELLGTALRETEEELGLPASGIEVLGRFHDYLSINDQRVTPFAGYLAPGFLVHPQPEEVAEVLEVPFEVFLDPARLRTEQRRYRGKLHEILFFRHGNDEIWGLTARIIREFMQSLQPPQSDAPPSSSNR